MRSCRLQNGSTSPHQIAWLRWISVLCVLLLCIMSTAQVAHHHSDDLAQQPGSHQNLPSSDHCPLCLAMHSALPSPFHLAPEPVVEIRVIASVAAEVKRVFEWQFHLAIRPPPADLQIA